MAAVDKEFESDQGIADVDSDEDDDQLSGDESDDSGSDGEEGPRAEPAKNAIYNREAIAEKVEDIAWPDNIDWVHRLSVDYEQNDTVDVNDDLSRELAFYMQALEGSRQALDRLQAIGLPFLRPPDYYAEMVKSDKHMLKVKGRLLAEKKRIEVAEERKKARESKKIAKEVQAEKEKERVKRKKEDIKAVEKWRKQRQQSGFAKGEGEEMDFDFGGENKPFSRSGKKQTRVAPGDRSGRMNKWAGKKGGGGSKGKKREHREKKFGYGGRKGLKKQNTADTTNDLRGFNQGAASKNKRRKI